MPRDPYNVPNVIPDEIWEKVGWQRDLSRHWQDRPSSDSEVIRALRSDPTIALMVAKAVAKHNLVMEDFLTRPKVVLFLNEQQPLIIADSLLYSSNDLLLANPEQRSTSVLARWWAVSKGGWGYAAMADSLQIAREVCEGLIKADEDYAALRTPSWAARQRNREHGSENSIDNGVRLFAKLGLAVILETKRNHGHDHEVRARAQITWS